MRLGLMIEGQEGLTWERWFKIADTVESAGLDSLWRSDHFLSSAHPTSPSLECWVSLTELALRSKRIEFGPLVSPMTFRNPALLARMAAAVDQLSHGRLVTGVGAGWNEVEHEAYGIRLPPMKERMDRLEEGIEVILRLWQGGPSNFDGSYYQLHDATGNPRPFRQPRPPILVGGDGEVRLLRIVAKYADEWNSHELDQAAYRHKLEVLEAHCKSVGRDPKTIRRSMMIGVCIGRDAAGVEEEGRWLRDFLPSLGQLSDKEVLPRLRSRGWLVGTPDEIGEQLEAWSELGVDRVMLQYFHQENLEGIELAGQVNSRFAVSLRR
jgi:F420-dependent oxidoreductase-like protein